jgi:hypothetical protein
MSHRKLLLLEHINRHGVVRSNFLYALDGGNWQNTKVALQQLREAGLICRPTQQLQSLNARYAFHIYSLTPKGEQALPQYGITPVRWSVQRQFWHKVMVADILISLELIARARQLPFKHKYEIIGDKPLALPAGVITHPITNKTYDGQLLPDALMAIGDTNFLVEADRNTESIERADFSASSYLRKLLQYKNVFQSGVYKTEWNIPSLFVLNVTISESHAQNIVTFAESRLQAKSRSLLFKGIPLLGSHTKAVKPLSTLADEPWQRAGHLPHTLQL